MRDSVEESSLGYAWLVLPVGGFLSIAVPFAVVWSQNISTSTPYGQALLYYGVAAFIELCAEPHYIRAMRMSAFKLRLSAETTSTVLRSFLTYALVSYNQDVVLAFAYSQVRIIKLLPPRDIPSSARATDDDLPAQLVYAISMAVIYLNAAPNASERETGKDEATVKLIGIFSLQVSTFSRQHRPHLIVVQPQAVWKLILAEGEKAALIAVAAADEVGVYGLVASLG